MFRSTLGSDADSALHLLLVCLRSGQMGKLRAQLKDAHNQLQSLSEVYAITKRLQAQNKELQDQLRASGNQVRSLAQAATQRQQQLLALQQQYSAGGDARVSELEHDCRALRAELGDKVRQRRLHAPVSHIHTASG